MEYYLLFKYDYFYLFKEIILISSKIKQIFNNFCIFLILYFIFVPEFNQKLTKS